MTLEQATATLLANFDRKIGSVLDGPKAAVFDQTLAAAEFLAKHLRNAPAGTTVRDVMSAHKMTQATT
tara:strand:- start:126145 stop:126348 length:204 start_codon:yes stop_codon:yes gene_type:complete